MRRLRASKSGRTQDPPAKEEREGRAAGGGEKGDENTASHEPTDRFPDTRHPRVATHAGGSRTSPNPAAKLRARTRRGSGAERRGGRRPRSARRRRGAVRTARREAGSTALRSEPGAGRPPQPDASAATRNFSSEPQRSRLLIQRAETAANLSAEFNKNKVSPKAGNAGLRAARRNAPPALRASRRTEPGRGRTGGSPTKRKEKEENPPRFRRLEKG